MGPICHYCESEVAVDAFCHGCQHFVCTDCDWAPEALRSEKHYVELHQVVPLA